MGNSNNVIIIFMDPTGEIPTGEIPPITPEVRMRMFQTVHEMIKGGQISAPEGKIEFSPSGQTSSKDTAEFISGMESLDVTEVKPGDVIWWQTKNSRNYFVVEDVSANKVIKGAFQNFRDDGKENRSFEEATFSGASKMGDVLVAGKIVKGIPVELKVPDPEHQGEIPSRRIFNTTSVLDMGIVSRTEINPEAQNTPTP